jgi:hypothetical protein
MRAVHDFERSLRLSQEQSASPWWELVYREAFPEFAGMTYVGDCPTQRDGVDRLVVTSNGHVHRVDEKVRTVDYPDICLEYWSSVERRSPGWVAKDLGCDFIAYAFVPSGRCYLLPSALLRRAWRLHGRHWVRMGEARHDGFRLIEAQNRGYVTRSVAVPIEELLDAIRGASVRVPKNV